MLNRWKNNNELYKYKNQIYDKAEIEEARKKPLIVHFAGGIVKPWVNIRASYAQEWWKFAKKIMPEEEYLNWYRLAEGKTKKRDWVNVTKHVQDMPGKKYVYGYTKYSALLADILVENGINVVAYIDKNKMKQEENKSGIPVIDVREAVKDTEASYVIASQGAYKEIIQQLMELGVERQKIFWCEGKTDLYYMTLEPEYYEYEYRDIMSSTLGEIVWNMEIEEIRRNDLKRRWEYIWR